MSSTSSTARPRRARVSGPDGAEVAGRSRRQTATIPMVSAEQRHVLIAEAAYRRAEQRGFEGGDPVADWLESEKEVDALLSRATN